MGHEAEPAEAEDHHSPRRGFGDGGNRRKARGPESGRGEAGVGTIVVKRVELILHAAQNWIVN
jgi:hypothetical protein